MGLEVIREVHRKKAEEREMRRKEVIDDVFNALKELSDEVFFEEAYVFGSITKPYQFWESSDIDIAFKGFDNEKLFSATGFLSARLERDVNLISIEKVHFRDKIIMEGLRWKKD